MKLIGDCINYIEDNIKEDINASVIAKLEVCLFLYIKTKDITIPSTAPATMTKIKLFASIPAEKTVLNIIYSPL